LSEGEVAETVMAEWVTSLKGIPKQLAEQGELEVVE
jgi:hypothetical protein